MASIEINLKPAVIQAILDDFELVFPIPVDGNGDPLFSRAQWAKEKVKHYVKSIRLQAKNKRLALVQKQARLAAKHEHENEVIFED